MIKSAIPLTPRALFVLALLIILGFLGNYWSLPLFFGVDFILGSIPVLIVVYFYGVGLGTLAALIASSYTYFLWGHPYAVIIFSLEALFVGFFLHQGRRSLLLLDGLYWLIMGIPAAGLFYGVVMHMDGVSTLLIMLKQAVNGIFNALLASLVITYLPFRKILKQELDRQTTSLQETLLNLLVALILVPALFIMLLNSRGVIQEMQAETLDQMERVGADISSHLGIWHQRNLEAVTELAALAAKSPLQPSPALQHATELIHKVLLNFQVMYVANSQGTAIAFSPAVNKKGQKTVGLNFADRPYVKEMQTTRQPVVSEVFMGRGATFLPVVSLSVPILKGDSFWGYALGSIDLARLQGMLEPYGKLRHLSITLIDSQGQVITSTVPDRQPMMAWKRSEASTLKLIQNSVYHWFPGDEKLPNKMTRWKNSFYVQETTVANLPWKLIVEAPLAPLQSRLYTTYVHNLGIMAGMAVLALLIAMIFSRWLVRPLKGLARVTSNLPEKLLAHQDILWPDSSAAEIHSLVGNFQDMAQTLEGNVQELQERSTQLANANQGLEGEIAARIRMEEALRRSETLLRNVFESIPDLLTVQDRDFNIIMSNWHGLGESVPEAERSRPRKCHEIYLHRDHPCEPCQAMQVFASGQPVRLEKFVPVDNSIREIMTYPVRDQSGQVIMVAEYVRDITQRHHMEEALKESETKYRLLAENARDLIWRMDLDQQINFASPAVQLLTGFKPEEFITMGLDQILTPASLQVARENIARLQKIELREKPPLPPSVTLEIEHRRKDGATIWAEVQATILRGSQGETTGLMGVSRDITERRQVQEALRESEKRFRDISENAAEWVWETDVEGKFTYSSSVVEKVLGYKPEELLDKYLYDLFLPEERDKLRQAAFTINVTKQPFRDFINPNLHKNGEIVWLSTSGVAVLDAQGNFLGYRGANVDITERRKSQEALEIANTQMKALLDEADERNRAMALLNEMADVLQSCRTSAEAFEAIDHFVPRFFPNDAGALYLLRNSKNLLSPVTVWGQPPPSEEMFPPDDCWAIRGGRVHQVDDPDSALLCKHVPLTSTLVTGYLCVPLMAQGTSLGIFHLRFLSCATGGREAGELEAKQRLAVAIAENLSLALANLKLRETLQNQAILDPLTGLYNRRYLEETMDREIHRARRQKIQLAVAMMDLDRFKDFNDTFGKAAGDALLSALANVITTGIRAEDIACRYSGEKFLLIMPGASSPAVLERAENLRQAAKTLQVKYQNQLLKSTTISLGVAIFPDHGLTADEVIAAADAALYRAKQAGRDRVEIARLNSPGVAAH